MSIHECTIKNKTSKASNKAGKTSSIQPVKALYHTQEEAAGMLGLSVRTFNELRRHHPLYAPDGSRTTKDDPKKDSPLWSIELVELIAFARRKTAQGEREFTDDAALKIRKGMGNKKRREYLEFIED